MLRLRHVTAALTLMGGALTGRAAGQTNVQIEFVAPTAAMVATFGAANVTGGYATGYRGVVITPANLAQFRALAPDSLEETFDSLQPGTTLRGILDSIFTIAGGRVDVRYVLQDDRTGFPGTTGIFHFQQGISWPIASVYPHPTAANRFEGLVRLSLLASNRWRSRPGAGGWLNWESVIIHETLHTQMTGEKTKWSSILITYGSSVGHEESEFLGDEEIPFEEGLGTFFGETRNDPVGYNRAVRFHADTSHRYWIDTWSVLTPNLAAFPSVSKDTTPPFPPPTPGGRYAIDRYKWSDVEGRYILFSERTSIAMHHFFWRNACTSRNAARSMVLASARTMWQDRKKRYLFHAADQLARQLEILAAAPTGPGAQACGNPVSSMLPYALIDALTRFNMTDSAFTAMIQRDTPNPASRAAGQYLTHRAALRQRAQPHLSASPIRMEEAVRDMVTYLRQPATLLAGVP
jgi:hypothetical protein